MGFLDQLKKRENTQYQKMQNKNYYFSEESKKKGKQLYEDKKNYIKITLFNFKYLSSVNFV